MQARGLASCDKCSLQLSDEKMKTQKRFVSVVLALFLFSALLLPSSHQCEAIAEWTLPNDSKYIKGLKYLVAGASQVHPKSKPDLVASVT